MRKPLVRLQTHGGGSVARPRRKARQRALSPVEVVAKEAEVLANDRLGLRIDGFEYVTDVDGEPSVDVARMLQELLAN